MKRPRSKDRGRNVSFSSFSTRKRDSTPGISDIFYNFDDEFYIINQEYDNVFITANFDRNDTQSMILDIGCPKSLMGISEYCELFDKLSVEERKLVRKYPCLKKFKFGPSRVYESSYQVRIPIALSSARLMLSFYVIDGEIPILIVANIHTWEP